MRPKPKTRNALLWLFEPLEDDPRYLRRRFFGMEAAYLDGRLVLGLIEGKEPWNGLMVCTSRERQAALRAQFPQLKPHTVLGKWLYLSVRHPEFESVAPELVELARRRDARVGIEPK